MKKLENGKEQIYYAGDDADVTPELFLFRGDTAGIGAVSTGVSGQQKRNIGKSISH